MIHLFVRRLVEAAGKIEQELFRIEEQRSWAACWINGMIAGGAVAIVAWAVMTLEQDMLALSEGDLLLFACLGSSSSAVVFAPLAKTNSLRSIVLAYVTTSLISIAMYPIRESPDLPLPFQCFLAVCLSIALMRSVDAMHPAAVGSGMAFLIYRRDVWTLLLLMLAVVTLLVVVKILAYIYRRELTFKDFHREFRREFYGAELTVTMVPTKTDPEPEMPAAVSISEEKEGLKITVETVSAESENSEPVEAKERADDENQVDENSDCSSL